MVINNKRLAYQLLETCPFINTVRMWNSVEEALSARHKGTFNLRFKDRPGIKCVYGITPEDLENVFRHSLNKHKLSVSRVVISEDPPDASRTLQGELTERPELHLEYNFLKFACGPALRIERHLAGGLTALQLLRAYLTPGSLEEFYYLLNRFPGHVIEFSAFDISVGRIPTRNHIIWEVRNY